MREINKKPNSERLILSFGLAIFLCVFLGPFNTSADLAFWDRVAFWTIAITIIGIFMEICISAAYESIWLKKFHISVQVIIGSAIGGVPGSAFVTALNRLFRPEHLDDLIFPVLWVQVTIMAVLISGLELLLANVLGKTDETPPETDELVEKPIESISLPRLISRLPSHLREGQIISMSMQDHYVEVTTTLGSDMLLMRLSDAIDLLDGKAGAQIHRSHWAAQSHALAIVRKGRRFELSLTDGRKLPVSNSYKSQVEAMLHEKGQA